MGKKEKFTGIAFLGIAVLSLIFACVCFAMDTDHMYGTTQKFMSYGGDAYTGIQNAAAQTATNTYHVGNNISNFAHCMALMGGFAFLITAFAFAAVGIGKLLLIEQNGDVKNSDEIKTVITGENAGQTEDVQIS